MMLVEKFHPGQLVCINYPNIGAWRAAGGKWICNVRLNVGQILLYLETIIEGKETLEDVWDVMLCGDTKVWLVQGCIRSL